MFMAGTNGLDFSNWDSAIKKLAQQMVDSGANTVSGASQNSEASAVSTNNSTLSNSLQGISQNVSAPTGLTLESPAGSVSDSQQTGTLNTWLDELDPLSKKTLESKLKQMASPLSNLTGFYAGLAF